MSLRRFFLFSILLPAAVLPAMAQVTVSGRELLVNGQPFTVQGVDYSPTPVGNTVQNLSSNCQPGNYTWWTDTPAYTADFPLIAKMGANTIRTYGTLNSNATASSVLAALNYAQANHLYVVMDYYVQSYAGYNIGDPANQTQITNELLTSVNNYKNNPAVLMWSIGNEQNLNNGNNSTWYNFLNTLAGQVKAADPNHPVATVEGECPQGGCATTSFNVGNAVVQADDAHMTNLDIWGVNAYRGKTFEGLFQALVSSTTKPVYVAEFGKDAWHDAIGAEDQAMQASYLQPQWQEISSNLSASSPSNILIGGSVFEWTDEWWKDSSDDCITHGYQYAFSRSDDTVDPNYQNEWFGMAAVSPVNAVTNPDGTQRLLRTDYTTMQTFWNPTAAQGTGATATGFFSGTVHNYPNPFQLGAGSTKFVVLAGEAGSVDIRIYDAGGQFVTSLSGTVTPPAQLELIWDGHNSQGSLVSSGLYIAKIHGHSAAYDETQYRRVVGVK